MRLLDALAAIPAMKLASINQMRAERALQNMEDVADEDGVNENELREPADMKHPAISGIDGAAKRLLECLHGSKGAKQGVDFWLVAIENGIPASLGTNEPFLSFRTTNFVRKTKTKEAELDKFGGHASLADYGKASGWRQLCQHLVDKKLGMWVDGDKKVKLVRQPDGVLYVGTLKLSQAAEHACVNIQ